jgi:predicted phage tail protein
MESGTSPEKSLSTNELVRRAMTEARLLAKAELLHAKVELAHEVKAARVGGLCLGAAGALALVVLTLLLTAAADALALPLWAGALVVAGIVLVLAGVLAAVGWKRLPRKPMHHTLERLSMDLEELKQHVERTRH